MLVYGCNISKKSFIRLLNAPGDIIASTFQLPLFLAGKFEYLVLENLVKWRGFGAFCYWMYSVAKAYIYLHLDTRVF